MTLAETHSEPQFPHQLKEPPCSLWNRHRNQGMEGPGNSCQVTQPERGQPVFRVPSLPFPPSCLPFLSLPSLLSPQPPLGCIQ